MRITIAERLLQDPGTFEPVVWWHLPGEAHAAVHLDRHARVLERGLARQELGRGCRARRVTDARVIEHGGCSVGRAAGKGGAYIHVGEQVLDGLERADGNAELL